MYVQVLREIVPSHRNCLSDAIAQNYWHPLELGVLKNHVHSEMSLLHPGLSLASQHVAQALIATYEVKNLIVVSWSNN